MALHFPEQKATFIHIPKTAGSSFEQWAVENFKDVVVIRDGNRHAKMSYLDSQFDLGYTFTFVRNPFSRLVSIFNFVGQRAQLRQYRRSKGKRVKKMTNAEIDQSIVDQYNQGFEQYVIGLQDQNLTEQPYEQGRKWYLRITPMCQWLDMHCDKIIKIEDINTEFDHIKKFLGCNQNLPFINSSRHGHYKEYYTSETRNIVEKIFSEDLEAFGYDF